MSCSAQISARPSAIADSSRSAAVTSGWWPAPAVRCSPRWQTSGWWRSGTTATTCSPSRVLPIHTRARCSSSDRPRPAAPCSSAASPGPPRPSCCCAPAGLGRSGRPARRCGAEPRGSRRPGTTTPPGPTRLRRGPGCRPRRSPPPGRRWRLERRCWSRSLVADTCPAWPVRTAGGRPAADGVEAPWRSAVEPRPRPASGAASSRPTSSARHAVPGTSVPRPPARCGPRRRLAGRSRGSGC